MDIPNQTLIDDEAENRGELLRTYRTSEGTVMTTITERVYQCGVCFGEGKVEIPMTALCDFDMAEKCEKCSNYEYCKEHNLPKQKRK